ncbi:MAG: hypothetical protein ABI760_18105 [Ferruginibacter sp.]
MSTKIFQKLFNIAEVSNLPKEQLIEYKKCLIAHRENMAILNTAREESFKIGMEKGMEKAIEKGMEKKSYEVVNNLLATGNFTISEIAKIVDVTQAFVKMARRDLKK